MFRRTDESEWARFSKAFPSKDEKKEENGQADAGAVAPNERPTPAASDDDRAAVTPVVSSAQRLVGESNLTLTRPAPALSTASAYPEEVESTIGPSTVVDGKYKSESGVRILGAAQGEIESAKSIYIEENAKVSAKVTAACIIVAGEVNGELHCTGRVEIRPSGRVTGTINAGTLIMQEGAFFDGNLKMKQSGTETGSPRSS